MRRGAAEGFEVFLGRRLEGRGFSAGGGLGGVGRRRTRLRRVLAASTTSTAPPPAAVPRRGRVTRLVRSRRRRSRAGNSGRGRAGGLRYLLRQGRGRRRSARWPLTDLF